MNIRGITRDGHAYTVDDNRHGSEFDFWDVFERRTWEPEVEGVLNRFLTPQNTFLDLGAWVGPITMLAAPRCRQVHAVEPDPVAAHDLRTNLVLSDITNVTVHECALADRAGTIRIGPVHGGVLGDSMTTVWTAPKSSVKVQATTLGILILENGIHDLGLIKMDVEGAEETILPAVASLLQYIRVPLLLSTHAALSPEPSAYLDVMSTVLGTFDVEVIDGDMKDLAVLLVMPRDL